MGGRAGAWEGFTPTAARQVLRPRSPLDRSAPGAWGASGTSRAPAADAFRLGEDVVHAAFGEGVVTALEPDGVIVVRFAGDGSERKLMAEYAPVSRR